MAAERLFIYRSRRIVTSWYLSLWSLLLTYLLTYLFTYLLTYFRPSLDLHFDHSSYDGHINREYRCMACDLQIITVQQPEKVPFSILMLMLLIMRKKNSEVKTVIAIAVVLDTHSSIVLVRHSKWTTLPGILVSFNCIINSVDELIYTFFSPIQF